MDYSQFYDFYGKDNAFRVVPCGYLGRDNGSPYLRGTVREVTTWRYSMGRRTPDDFVPSEWPGLYLLGPRARAVLHDAGATGWDSYPVTLLGPLEEDIPDYHFFVVTGRSGDIDNSLCPVVILPSPVAVGKAMPHWIGMYFPADSWDGSDIFAAGDWTMTIMVQRIYNAIVRAKLTGITFKRLTDIKRLKY